MSGPGEPKPKPSKIVTTCTILCMFISIGVFQALAPTWFPRQPGQGINFEQTFWAAMVGGVSAGIGSLIGTMIARIFQK